MMYAKWINLQLVARLGNMTINWKIIKETYHLTVHVIDKLKYKYAII